MEIPDKRLCVIPTLLSGVLLLGGCMTTRVEQITNAATGLDAGEAVVIIESSYHQGNETEDGFVNCVTKAVQKGKKKIQVYPDEQFVDALFPWFEPRTMPTGPNALPDLMAKPGVAERIRESGVRYIVWLNGDTERTAGGGSLSCAVGPGGGGCFGLAWWENDSTYEASVWDIEDGKAAGEVTAAVRGTSMIPAVVVPYHLSPEPRTPPARAWPGNCRTSSSPIRPDLRVYPEVSSMYKTGGIAALVSFLFACGAVSAGAPTYAVTFGARVEANNDLTAAFIEVDQPEQRLEQVRLRAPENRYSDFVADGALRREGDRIIWNPPANGGRLSYRVHVENRRNSKGLDAMVAEDFALLRGEDLFPPAAISQMDGTESDSRLLIDLPEGWRLLSAWPKDGRGGRTIRNPKRKFDRPTGWLAAGRLGVRREKIAGIQVAVGGPLRQGVQRVSMLALMRWTLPSLVELIPGEPPERLLLVSAGDPMWRGGLSGPNSLYLHAERPLLSEDGTSTLLHELIHVLLPVAAARDQDWIDEGLAEYLTLRLLRDTDTISARRYRRSIDRFRKRSAGQRLTGTEARGAQTARAVVLFHDLDAELLAASGGRHGMLDFASALSALPGPVDLAALTRLAAEIGGNGPYPSLANADEQRP